MSGRLSCIRVVLALRSYVWWPVVGSRVLSYGVTSGPKRPNVISQSISTDPTVKIIHTGCGSLLSQQLCHLLALAQHH